MRASAMLGIDCRVAGPKGKDFDIEDCVWEELKLLMKDYGGKVTYFEKAEEAVKDVDIIYTDSWMSYGIDPKLAEMRKQIFMP